MADLKELGHTMRVYRNVLGIKGADLSKMLGYNEGYMNSIECGARKMSLPKIKQWAEICIQNKETRENFYNYVYNLYKDLEIEKADINFTDLCKQGNENDTYKQVQDKIYQIERLVNEIKEILNI